ncbi:MAG: sulfite exporter TauE/SafE family protein, partial [Gammaproteobacteria bacterium]|nr:sulfite exporter TauE/SafE family protein [Gammaproteobacteria bacterium]
VCIYGGYFNGGLGIILLASFGLMGQTNLHGMNGLKNLISALLTAIAVVVYAAGNVIDGQYLLLLAVMAIIGGYVGAALAYRISQPLLRGFIVIVGLAMALGFFIR